MKSKQILYLTLTFISFTLNANAVSKLAKSNPVISLPKTEVIDDIKYDESAFMRNGALLTSSQDSAKENGVTLNINREGLIDIFTTSKNKKVIKLEINNFDPTAITLSTLVYEAVKKNLDLQLSQEQTREAKWNFWQQFSKALPDIAANLGMQHLDGTFFLNSRLQAPVDESQSFARLNMNWRAFNGGNTTMLILAQKYFKKVADENRLNQLNLTILESVSLYHDLLQAQSALASRKKAYEEAEANLQLTKSHFEIGTGTYYAFLQTKARQAFAKQQLLLQEAEFRKAQINIARLLNADLETPYIIEQEKIKELKIIDPTIEFSEFKKIALDKNPLIKQALYNEKAFRRSNYASFGQFLPKVDLYLNQNAIGPDFGSLNNVTTAGFQMNLEFGKGVGLFSAAEIGRTKSKLNQAKIQHINTILNIEAELRSAFLDYEAAKSNIVEAREQLKASTEALRLSHFRYENGIEIINNLVENETALSNAEVNIIASVTNYNNAQARLAYLMGNINIQDILRE